MFTRISNWYLVSVIFLFLICTFIANDQDGNLWNNPEIIPDL